MVPKLSRDDENPTPIFTSSSRELGDRPVLAVIGVGYVGEHLVYSFSSSFNVIGYDVSPSRLEKLRSGNYQPDRIRFTNNVEDLRRASNFLISVPTTLRRDGSVDLSHIEDALAVVRSNARRGSIVVIESTVAIGTTRRLLEPLARSRGVFAGMSPEVSAIIPQPNNIQFVTSQNRESIPGESRLLPILSQKLYLHLMMSSLAPSMQSLDFMNMHLILLCLSASPRSQRW